MRMYNSVIYKILDLPKETRLYKVNCKGFHNEQYFEDEPIELDHENFKKLIEKFRETGNFDQALLKKINGTIHYVSKDLMNYYIISFTQINVKPKEENS